VRSLRRPARSPRSARRRWRGSGSGGGCTGQARADWGLPECSGNSEVATVGGAKDFVDGSDSPMDPRGGNEPLRWGVREGGGEVRPSRVKGASFVELTEKAESGGDRFGKCGEGSGGVATGAGREAKGEQGCACIAGEGKPRNGGGGGAATTVSILNAASGGGGWVGGVVPRGRRGLREGGVPHPDQHAAPRPAAARSRPARAARRSHAMQPVRTGEAESLMGGPCLQRRAAAVQSNKNPNLIEFKRFQIVSNFDHHKMPFSSSKNVK
jgi:hypothetical protein